MQGEDGHLQAKECLGLPEARREASYRFSLTASEGTSPANGFVWDFCDSSLSVRGTLLRQPQETSTKLQTFMLTTDYSSMFISILYS